MAVAGLIQGFGMMPSILKQNLRAISKELKWAVSQNGRRIELPIPSAWVFGCRGSLEERSHRLVISAMIHGRAIRIFIFHMQGSVCLTGAKRCILAAELASLKQDDRSFQHDISHQTTVSCLRHNAQSARYPSAEHNIISTMAEMMPINQYL
jgi:hypothetical protein